MTLTLADLTSEHFAPFVNQTFRLELGPTESIEAELIEVTGPPAGSPPRQGSPPGRPFSLVFRVAKTQAISQGIRRVVHDRVGSFDLFLVPIGPDSRGMCLEAVFN